MPMLDDDATPTNPTANAYDAIAAMAVAMTQPDALVLIIVNGNRGSGVVAHAPMDVVFELPKILRELADKIADDQREMVAPNAPKH